MFGESLGLVQIMHNMVEDNKKMCIEFDRRAEVAKAKYWDACKLPRKQKKVLRKKAFADYVFYKQLAEPVIYGF